MIGQLDSNNPHQGILLLILPLEGSWFLLHFFVYMTHTPGMFLPLWQSDLEAPVPLRRFWLACTTGMADKHLCCSDGQLGAAILISQSWTPPPCVTVSTQPLLKAKSRAKDVTSTQKIYHSQEFCESCNSEILWWVSLLHLWGFLASPVPSFIICIIQLLICARNCQILGSLMPFQVNTWQGRSHFAEQFQQSCASQCFFFFSRWILCRKESVPYRNCPSPAQHDICFRRKRLLNSQKVLWDFLVGGGEVMCREIFPWGEKHSYSWFLLKSMKLWYSCPSSEQLLQLVPNGSIRAQAAVQGCPVLVSGMLGSDHPNKFSWLPE